MAPASSNDGGFTLVEAMVSLVILSVGILGFLQAVNMSMEHNMRNQLRNEGASLADTELAYDLSKGFDNVSTPSDGSPFKRTDYSKTRLVMNLLQKSYSVTRTGSNVNRSKMVNFRVSWRYKKERYNVDASSVITAPK